MDKSAQIHRALELYFAEKLREHGPTPRGVDWNSEAGQVLRFRQLARLVQGCDTFSVNDIGCGYGALLGYLISRGMRFEYCGVDISEDMVTKARALHPQNERVSFLVNSIPDRPRDYCVASGIFNIRLNTPDDEWLKYIMSVVDMMHDYGLLGFAFNMLTRYSDADKMRGDLYYADPLHFFDHCKQRYSRNVALLHDYGLYEFTILVRKNIN